MADLNTLKEHELIQKLSERLDSVSDDVRENTDKAIAAVRGIINRLETSSTEFFNDLVKAGEQLEKEKEKERKKSNAKATHKNNLESLLDRLYDALGLSTQDEVEALNKKINSLTRKIRKLEKELAA